MLSMPRGATARHQTTTNKDNMKNLVRITSLVLAASFLAACIGPAGRSQVRQQTRVQERTENRMERRGW